LERISGLKKKCGGENFRPEENIEPEESIAVGSPPLATNVQSPRIAIALRLSTKKMPSSILRLTNLEA
jgi:hypothetical protein